MLIYKISNDINNKLYIGQTSKSLQERIMQHRNAFVSGTDTHLYRAMRKYGWDKFHFETIDVSPTDQSELDELEQYYIHLYDTIEHGYNMIDGGMLQNPMHYAKSRNKHDEVMRSHAVREKISISMKASYAKRGGPSKEHRSHLSEQKKLMYASEQGDIVRARFRQSFKMTEEHRHALIEGRRKGVYCIDISGQVIRHFDKVKDAAIWWMQNGYVVKEYSQLCDKIKQSFTEDRYIKGLKWIYDDPEAGYRA